MPQLPRTNSLPTGLRSGVSGPETSTAIRRLVFVALLCDAGILIARVTPKTRCGIVQPPLFGLPLPPEVCPRDGGRCCGFQSLVVPAFTDRASRVETGWLPPVHSFDRKNNYEAFLPGFKRDRCSSFLCSIERTRWPRFASWASSCRIASRRSCLWP